jgi:hypothetical protein
VYLNTKFEIYLYEETIFASEKINLRVSFSKSYNIKKFIGFNKFCKMVNTREKYKISQDYFIFRYGIYTQEFETDG